MQNMQSFIIGLILMAGAIASFAIVVKMARKPDASKYVTGDGWSTAIALFYVMLFTGSYAVLASGTSSMFPEPFTALGVSGAITIVMAVVVFKLLGAGSSGLTDNVVPLGSGSPSAPLSGGTGARKKAA
jgi:uncharacterized membrane protein YkvI